MTTKVTVEACASDVIEVLVTAGDYTSVVLPGTKQEFYVYPGNLVIVEEIKIEKA